MPLHIGLVITVLLFAVSCFGPLDPYDVAPSEPDDTTTVPSDGLVAWWTCNDSAGSTLSDSAGASHGQIVGCDRDSGIEGLGLSFDGSGDHVVILPAKDSLFDFGEGDFTISVWVKPRIINMVTDSTRYDIIAKGSAGKNGYALSVYRNSFSAFVGPYYSSSNDTVFPANENVWRHCVMIRSRKNVSLYVDNRKIQSYTSESDVSTSVSLLIGSDASSRLDRRFPGIIDEIKISDAAWSAADVAAEYGRFTK